MKRKIYLCVILIITLVSCDDSLDLNPISAYSAGGFYQTQSDFELASNGVYDILQSLGSKIALDLEARSDNVQDDLQNNYSNNSMHRFLDNETTSDVSSLWIYYWMMIDRCNEIIDKIDDGTFEEEEYRSYYKGEAYFLRGYAYFSLGWQYGGTQIIDHKMKIDEIKTTKRSTQTETLDFAASDLENAASLLPEKWKSYELGKATKYAAQGILARLYLFQKKYSDAKPLLESIINSGYYKMATNYEDCFLDKYDNSSEHVFQIQYISGDLNEGNDFVSKEVPQFYRSELFPSGGCSGANMVSYDLYDSYEDGDFRRDFSIQKGYTDNTGIYDPTTLFYIKFAHGTIPANRSDYEVNLPILRYTDVKLMYAEVLNEEGYKASGEAFEIINKVRSRAGLSALTSSDISLQEDFRTALFKERRVEFSCEFMRLFDLLRTDKAMSVMNTFFTRTEEGSGKYKMEEYRKIFAIPLHELNNMSEEYMWQNPGY